MSTSDEAEKITLLGTHLAREGMQFVFMGETSLCRECRLRGACLKLERGRLYEVKVVKKIKHSCPVHEDGVVTVHVIEPEIITTFPSRIAVKGATQRYERKSCGMIDCINYVTICNPEYLQPEDKLYIVEVQGKMECPAGYDLKIVKTIRKSDLRERK